tara:strand:+ start:34 stop:984 length:951 start_codon:yes stop_codon:yes gene_type:complete
MTEVETKLFSLFSDFIRDLSKVFPEIKNSLYRNYEDCLSDTTDKCLSDFPKVCRFLELIGDYEKYIVDKNLEFFDLEVEFLEEISFHKLWEKNISNKTRESIWKYLQTFQLISINIKSGEKLNAVLDEVLNGSKMDKSTMKDYKNMRKLSEEVQSKTTSGQGSGGQENELDDMLSGLMDSGIGDIAKEVAKNLDIESMFGSIDENSNPMELMAQLMNPEKMSSIFSNINSVMEQKMENGELSKDDLKSEAEGMMGQMGSNPMFKNMMEQMGANEGAKEGANEGSKGEDKVDSKTELTREEKQKLLREKIKEKKENR